MTSFHLWSFKYLPFILAAVIWLLLMLPRYFILVAIALLLPDVIRDSAFIKQIITFLVIEDSSDGGY